jgi:hypothetical protein
MSSLKFGRHAAVHGDGADRRHLEDPPLDDGVSNDQMSDYWSSQCQKYEERIVELHSVIAELTRLVF